MTCFWGRAGWSGCRVIAALCDSVWGWRKQTGLEKDVKEKRNGNCNLCSAFTSDLPCMHLDPGVNRLGLNVTSIHQTDRRPVTPDIVFPICVILWPQEEGLKKTAKQQKKRSIHFTNTLKDQRSVVRLLPSGKKSVITKVQTETMQIKEGEKVSSEENTSGRDRGQRQETLWSNAGRPECSEHKQRVVDKFQKAAVWSYLLGVNQSLCTCFLNGGKWQFDWFIVCQAPETPQVN